MRADVDAAGASGGPTLRDLVARLGPLQPSTPDVIAHVLREAIIAGVLRGGSQLRQSDVAADFGVSVIPVREALRQLVAEGFVVLQRNRGAIVAEVSTDELRRLFDLRVVLETLLLAAAVPHLTSADLAKAEEFQKALEDETDINRWGRWNWRFHEALYKPSGRGRTLAIVENVNSHVDRLLRLQMSLVDGKRKSRREHGALLQACRRHDVDKAVSLLKQHIRGVEAIILGYASKQTSSGLAHALFLQLMRRCGSGSSRFPRRKLAHLPTPLEACPRLSAALGGPEILVKRDDMTGLAFGGNKARQLEFVFGQVLESGAETVVAGAYTQSNWCRQITAAARKYGLEPVLVLAHGLKGPLMQGNLLLDRLMDADVTILNVLDEELQPHLEAKAEALRKAGRRPYVISSFEVGTQSLAALGYVEAVLEICDQLGRAPDHIYVAGSEMSPAGLTVGARVLGLPPRVVSVSPIVYPESRAEEIARICNAIAARLGITPASSPTISSSTIPISARRTASSPMPAARR